MNRKNKQTHEKFTIQKEFEKASNTRNCVLGHCTFHPIFTILLENHYNGLNKYSGLGCGWSCVATWPPTNHPTFYLLATHLVIYIYISAPTYYNGFNHDFFSGAKYFHLMTKQNLQTLVPFATFFSQKSIVTIFR